MPRASCCCATRPGWLYEQSHSRKGAHIVLAAPLDASLPRKVVVGDGQEIEVFGHPGSDGNSVMLTANEMEGSLQAVPSVADVLPAPVLVAPKAAPESGNTKAVIRTAMTEHTAGSTGSSRPLSPTNIVNTMALAHLDRWVPVLWPLAQNKGKSGWRVPSEVLGRDLEEDLSFHKEGIKDFGVHDLEDPREGKRTAIEVVSEWMTGGDWKAAADKLRDLLGMPAYGAISDCDFENLEAEATLLPAPTGGL